MIGQRTYITIHTGAKIKKPKEHIVASKGFKCLPSYKDALLHNTCQFIFGGIDGECCGEERIDKSVYCERHYKLTRAKEKTND